MPVRKLIFWIHLIAGVVAGAVIVVMSATGIAIAFEEEILAWQDRDVSHIETGGERVALPVEELMDRVTTERPSFEVSTVTTFRDPQHAWIFSGHDGVLYVAPYTGSVRESRAYGAQEVIHKLEEWHRWLGAKDNVTSTGHLVTGICNLALVVLCVTGLYLWFPRRWSSRALKAILFLKRGSKGKARDFNWHNVFGFWSLPVLLVLAATGVVISFE